MHVVYYFSQFCLDYFSGVLFWHFFVVMFLFHLLQLCPCVCLYVLCRSATSLGLGRVPLCNMCPVGLKGTIALVTWDMCSKCTFFSIFYCIIFNYHLVSLYLIIPATTTLLSMSTYLFLFDQSLHALPSLPLLSFFPLTISLFLLCLLVYFVH